MSVQAVSAESLDPEGILRRLPSGDRRGFIGEYNSALDAAHEVWRYRQLQNVLRLWDLRATAYAQPDFQQRAQEAVVAEPGRFISAEQLFSLQAEEKA